MGGAIFFTPFLALFVTRPVVDAVFGGTAGDGDLRDALASVFLTIFFTAGFGVLATFLVIFFVGVCFVVVVAFFMVGITSNGPYSDYIDVVCFRGHKSIPVHPVSDAGL